MKIIIGLGNPGEEYQESRHNIGFRVVDYISKKYGGSFHFDKKSNSEISEIKIDPVKSAKDGAALRQFNRVNGERVLLVKPQTFVNNSGEAVKKLMKNCPDSALRNRGSSISQREIGKNLVVIHDDLDIPFGKMKLSFGRSSGGHKGVESVIRALKSEKFYRVRFGTFNSQLVKIRKIKDKKKRLGEMNKFVISSFGSSEKPKLNKLIKEAAEKVLQL